VKFRFRRANTELQGEYGTKVWRLRLKPATDMLLRRSGPQEARPQSRGAAMGTTRESCNCRLKDAYIGEVPHEQE
jgi:hypothetical protein